MKQFRKLIVVFLALTFVFVSACAGDDAGSDGLDNGMPVDENGKPTFLPNDEAEVGVGAKDDQVIGQRGLPVSVDSASTAVWEVKNAWEDTDTPAAREAGMAWGENSGLTWDEKYQLWVASFEKIDTVGGFSTRDTFEMMTPWGKTMPSPTLECAEVAIFLRITFASWYNLPFFMEARDKDGRLYFGHFGMRRADGKFGNMPNFKTRYKDFSDRADEVRNGGEWPSDSKLAELTIPGSFDDEQPQLGEGLHAGAYFDQVYLNKRVGYFLRLTLAWFGSVNLADPSNTYNLKPAAVKAGDVLVERWQKIGIGHTLVVMRSEEVTTIEDENGEVIPQMEVELASGSMPRRQPVWESPGATKRYFKLTNTGGPGFEEFGGGAKRWRTAKNINGRWTNVVMSKYSDTWIDSTDFEAIAARIDTFDKILVELSPEQKRDVLLEIIESKRQHLQQFPASCSARIGREEAFESLYELEEEEFGSTRNDVDNEYRRLEDYVFGELVYGESKTCCWNRSTNAMYDIIMDLNIKAQQDAEMCVAPIVFMNRDDDGDGYDLFRQHAIELDRESDWVAWSEDESCPQRDVAVDTEAEPDQLAFCELDSSGDPVEPPVDPGTNETVTLDLGTGDIPDNDETGLVLTVDAEAAGTLKGAALDINIEHTWRGDLEISVVHPDGTTVVVQEADGEQAENLEARYAIPDFFDKAASGQFQVIVKDTARQDTGRVVSATLELTVAQ